MDNQNGNNEQGGQQPGSGKAGKHSGRFFGLWLIGLAVFFAGLVAALGNDPELHGGEAQQQAALLGLAAPEAGSGSLAGSGADPGYVFRNLQPQNSLSNPKISFDPRQEYILVGAGLQGFYQTVGNIGGVKPVWSFDLPEYAFEAQLVRRGITPSALVDGIRLEWELAAGSNAPQSGGIIKGEMQPGSDGISFTGVIPAEAFSGLDYSRSAVYNPYPVVTIRAFDAQSGALLAESALAVGIAPDFGCAHCHADSQYSILQTHDLRQGTTLEAQARSGQTVECRACHSGISANNALNGGLTAGVPDAEQGKYLPGSNLGLSAAVHAWHTPYLAGQGEAACLSCHTGLGLNAGKEDRPRRLLMRDLHQERGLSCVRCHGVLEEHSLSLLQAEKAAGQPLAEKAIKRIEQIERSGQILDSGQAGLADQTDPAEPVAAKNSDEIKARLPWVQQPDCAGCHDFRAKPHLETSSAFNKWTEADYGVLFGSRAENTGKLRCISCHGAPHAIYPAKNPVGEGRDNLPPQQYQGDPRVLGGEGNCAVCHTVAMPVSIHHNTVPRRFTRIHVPEGVTLYMPQVRFSHDAHIYVECMECHHMGHEDGQQLLCTAAGCHDQPQANAKAGSVDYRYFHNAFHDLDRSCNSCHESRQQQELPAGPTNCQGCHRAPSPLWSQK
ncbi:MAG: cytochrome c3 family protein [Deltaproteobacteria bacterium]|jgi:hypothetical protein|nr:cytochrome c3 family protein [Deltaproteobacteria bacterium]